MEAPRDVSSKASHLVVVAHSLPAGFDCPCASPLFMRSHSDQLGCGRPLCAGSSESVSIVRSGCESSESAQGARFTRFSAFHKLNALCFVHHVLSPLL